jgi:hypothetical protein
MKFHHTFCVQSLLAVGAIAAFGAVLVGPAQAATVSGGALTLNLNRDALIAGTQLDNFPDAPTPEFQICCRPSIYLEEFYDSAAASTRTFEQIRQDNTPDLYDLVSDEISAVGLQFEVNGQTVPSPPARANQATTFSFDPNDLFGSATGKIGLGGVMRFRVDVAPPTNRVMIGDMALEYHPELEGTSPGRSGWLLENYIGFQADAFELYDVTTLLVGNSLTVNGNLGFGWGFDHLGSEDARLANTRIGTFSFETTVVPVPAAVWLFVSGLAGLLGSQRFRRYSTP